MRILNKVLIRFHLLLVTAPPSPKMLIEYSNIGESYHPSRGGNTVKWMREVARVHKEALRSN